MFLSSLCEATSDESMSDSIDCILCTTQAPQDAQATENAKNWRRKINVRQQVGSGIWHKEMF